MPRYRSSTVALLALAALIIGAPSSSAQISILTNGQVSVGTATPPANAQLYSRTTALITSASALRADNNATGNVDGIGVVGNSINAADYGVGGWFTGGWVGARTEALLAGAGHRTGTRARASGGTVYNRAIDAEAYGNSGVKYGIYATAWGSGTNWAGYFDGNVHVDGNLTWTSDERFKTDIQGLQGERVLDQVMRLSPKSYQYVADARSEGMHFAEGKQYGFIAQELGAVFPDVVSESTHLVDVETASGRSESKEVTFQAVNYIAMIPILVQAIQDQQEQIAALQAQLREVSVGAAD